MWHLTFATWTRTVLFLRPEDRRSFLRALVAAVEELVLFALVDDHLHLVVATDDPTRIAGIVLRMLRGRCEARIDAPRQAVVEGRSHLERLVGYLGRQPEKHGFAAGASYEGSTMVDLLGARRLDGFDPERLWRHLPRRGEAWLFAQAGLSQLPAVDPRDVSPRKVWEAALAAHLAEPEGRSEPTVRARATVTRICELSSTALARQVPIAAPAIRSLRSRYDLDPASIAATLRWLAVDRAEADRRASPNRPPAPGFGSPPSLATATPRR